MYIYICIYIYICAVNFLAKSSIAKIATYSMTRKYERVTVHNTDAYY